MVHRPRHGALSMWIIFYRQHARSSSCQRHNFFPAHCTVPTISELDKALAAAGELATTLKAAISIPTNKKLEHIKILQQLTRVLNSHPSPRVGEAPEPRVGAPTSSHDATAPRVLRTQPRIHRRQTRANNPMPPIIEETEDVQQQHEVGEDFAMPEIVPTTTKKDDKMYVS